MKIRQRHFETKTEQQTEWAALLSITTSCCSFERSEGMSVLACIITSSHVLPPACKHDSCQCPTGTMTRIVRPSTEKADVLLYLFNLNFNFNSILILNTMYCHASPSSSRSHVCTLPSLFYCSLRSPPRLFAFMIKSVNQSLLDCNFIYAK